MSDGLITLEHLRQTALEVQKIISEVEKAAANAITEIEREKQGALSGQKDQVLSFDSDGRPIAVEMSAEMLPLVDEEHGGTGQTSIDEMFKQYYKTLELLTLGSNSTSDDADFLYRLSSGEVRGLSLNGLRLAMIGIEKPINLSAADYETKRARAISLTTQLPTSGLTNGALYALYE